MTQCHDETDFFALNIEFYLKETLIQINLTAVIQHTEEDVGLTSEVSVREEYRQKRTNECRE